MEMSYLDNIVLLCDSYKKHDGYLPLEIKAVPEGTIVPIKNVLFTVENTDPECFWLTNYVETASIGGVAHLVNFKTTDNISALMMAEKFYSCPMAGTSIPASEHSTMTVWGQDQELEACRNLLRKFPTGPVACVSDSYNIWEACEVTWGETLKDEVTQRKGTLIIRPDSGDPVKVVPKILDILGEKYKYTLNSKNYKVLPPCLRIIQGDAVALTTIEGILESIKSAQWSTENVSFGSGGAILQWCHRDTMKCAFKCSHAIVDGKPIDVRKRPITDPNKMSKKGLLTLQLDPLTNKLHTCQEGTGDPEKDLLVTVFRNGQLKKEYTLDEIRTRSRQSME